jgi:beta-ketoacyl-acyl-carrier-protein synthase II
MSRRVVVTGMGTINPLGQDVAETWSSALDGHSAVGPITLFDASDLLVQIGCEVNGFDPERYMDAKQVRRRDRFQQFASAAAQQALAQSGVDVEHGREERFGVIVSTAVGGLETMQEGVLTMDERGPRRINPFLIPMFMPNGASGLIAIDVGAQGPCFSIASACATGADSIGQAALMIRGGVADVFLAGGAEATITKIGISSFDRLGALSRRNEDYSRTPAPFDKDRDGLVMGEGAAVLVLESLEHAQERSAEILAESIGYGSTEDAFHVTAPSEGGQGGATAMRLALQDAGLPPQDVDYINAHGTATVLNDVAETKAIKRAMGEAAYDIPVSSTKSMTGHLMGATGALEAIFCIQAIREDAVPPTIHFNEADPECDLDYVPNQAREMSVNVAMSNAFGFGGHNAVLAFKAFTG